ncbi:4-amino-4-deoxy-L-arabinose transferase [Hymenobacter daecheongensis DSM 21074]|uniref:4-amino-4-deoxy-L-arabinose transferase n=1 Tax=Hymenobacter daecheongensis DSM 21074 TaxID=1121955 RepID=A0A1M6KHL8_9BACT|nr:glycosyltransferase family 39 protein [Hymenobacter daecheongensis]SHJ58434.1 4-amino-4-deoxy-L-arabinose transferase [Hymenobacter daecheongensis DSM 21074]
MPASLSSRTWLWLFVMVLGMSLFVGLGSWGVLESSEARYAEIGREMLTGHDWLHPRLLGIQHFHKPPLTYWLTAAGLALAGPTAFGVRLLPVLAVLLQVALVYGLGLLLFANDRARALAAAIVYGTLPVVLISALNVTTDAYLQTLELAATYGILRHYAGGGRRWLYLFWVGLGLAFLTKGPVGFVLPLMAVIGFYFRQQQTRRSFTVHHLLGLGLFGLVGLSWYLYLMAEDSAFVRYFLFQHTVERFANPETFGRSKPWWFYLVLAPATSLPWSAALITQAIRTRWAEVPQQWRNVLVFWVLVPLGFFSLSGSKLLLYVLPIFPGVALLTVYYLGRLSDAALHRWYAGIGFFLGLLLAALCLLPLFVEALPVPLEISPATALWPAAGIVLLVLQHALWEQVRVAPRLLLIAVIFTAALLLTAKPILHQNQLAFNGSRPLADFIRSHHLENRPILVYDQLLPSLAFELGRLPVSLHDGNHNLTRETQFEPGQSWQQNLLYLTDTTQERTLRRLLPQHPVLLVKGEVKPERQWLVQAFSMQEKVGEWTVYSGGW